MIDNKLISNDQLVFFDFNTKNIIGLVNFKSPVIDIKIDKEAAYVLVNSLNSYKNLLIFDLKSLKCIYKIERLVQERVIYNNMTFFDCSLVAKDNLNGKLEVYKFYIKNDSIYSVSKVIINTAFNAFQYITFSTKGNMLLTISNDATKIHIYSMIDNQLKYQLSRGFSEAKINNICFSDTEKIIALLMAHNSIHFFNLENLDSIFEEETNYRKKIVPISKESSDIVTSYQRKTVQDLGQYRRNVLDSDTIKPKYGFSKKLKKTFTDYTPHFTTIYDNIDSDEELLDNQPENDNSSYASKKEGSSLHLCNYPSHSYSIFRKNKKIFNKIFYFKSINKIVELGSDGIKREYEIDYNTYNYVTERTKVFRIYLENEEVKG